MKTRKKKPAKAVTMLVKIEKLLADVLSEFSVIEKSVEKNVRELLVSAEASISQAKEFMTPSAGTAAKRHPRARAKKTTRKLVRAA